MDLAVEDFIVTHLDAIDTNLWMELFLEAYDLLSNAETEQVLNIFEQSGFNMQEILNARDSALHFIVTMTLEDMAPGLYAPAYFCGQHIRQYLGLKFYEFKKFLHDEASEWPDNVEILEYDYPTTGRFDLKVN